jgi:hypothetical protein
MNKDQIAAFELKLNKLQATVSCKNLEHAKDWILCLECASCAHVSLPEELNDDGSFKCEACGNSDEPETGIYDYTVYKQVKREQESDDYSKIREEYCK